MAEWCVKTAWVPMTAAANSLTKAATRRARKSAPFTTAAADVRTFVNGLEQLGHDGGALLAAAGVRGVDLHDPDARVPCDVIGALVAYAQRERFTPNIALAIAKVTPLGVYPLLDYLVVTSESVGAGLEQLARYLRLVGSPSTVEIHDAGGSIRVEVVAPSPLGCEFQAALIALHMRGETNGAFALEGVEFRHQPDDVAAFARELGCPVRGGAAWNGLRIGRDAWRLPLRRSDPMLRKFLERQADDMLARLPEQSGVALDVRRALASRVAAGDSRMSSIARQLGLSERTLHRRLAAEGVSYQDLLDAARKDAAGRYLKESTLSIGEIAYLLGYSEPASFHRAFKRWYRATPEAFRSAERR